MAWYLFCWEVYFSQLCFSVFVSFSLWLLSRVLLSLLFLAVLLWHACVLTPYSRISEVLWIVVDVFHQFWKILGYYFFFFSYYFSCLTCFWDSKYMLHFLVSFHSSWMLCFVFFFTLFFTINLDNFLFTYIQVQKSFSLLCHLPISLLKEFFLFTTMLLFLAYLLVHFYSFCFFPSGNHPTVYPLCSPFPLG